MELNEFAVKVRAEVLERWTCVSWSSAGHEYCVWINIYDRIISPASHTTVLNNNPAALIVNASETERIVWVGRFHVTSQHPDGR
jgi:hypothetical protein